MSAKDFSTQELTGKRVTRRHPRHHYQFSNRVPVFRARRVTNMATGFGPGIPSGQAMAAGTRFDLFLEDTMITLHEIVTWLADSDHNEPVRSLVEWYRVDRATMDAETRARWVGELVFASTDPRVRITDELRAEVRREIEQLNRPEGNN